MNATMQHPCKISDFSKCSLCPEVCCKVCTSRRSHFQLLLWNLLFSHNLHQKACDKLSKLCGPISESRMAWSTSLIDQPPPPQLTGRQNLNEWLEYFLYFWQKWIISNKLFHIFDCFFELTSILSSIDGNSKTDPSPYSLSWHEQETHLKLRSHPQQCTQSPGPENI